MPSSKQGLQFTKLINKPTHLVNVVKLFANFYICLDIIYSVILAKRNCSAMEYAKTAIRVRILSYPIN